MQAQQKKELRYRGISRAMADNSVTDGGVSESVNIIVDNGELAPIVAPKILALLPQDIKYDLLYIHSTSNYQNYIALYGGKICRVLAGSVSDFYTLQANETINSIKAIGNTLVVATNQRMFYVLYKDGQYNYLGEQIPFPDIRVYPSAPAENQKEVRINLSDMSFGEQTLGQWVASGQSAQIDSFYYGNDLEYPVDQQTTYSVLAKQLAELLWGKIEQKMKELRTNSIFPSVLLVRYAVRLFDGSYTRHSVPFLFGFNSQFISSIQHERVATGAAVDTCSAVGTIQNAYQIAISLTTPYSELSRWSDIIKGVDFFVSEPIHKDYKYNGNITSVSTGVYSLEEENKQEDVLANTSLFYRIKALDISVFGSSTSMTFNDIGETIKDNDVLRTQIKLTDDYRSHHKISASTIFEFNGRINIANIKTQYYAGPPRCASEEILQASQGATFTPWTMKFYLKGEDGVAIKVLRTYDFGAIAPGPWIVYPDSRCFKVDVYNDGTIKTVFMKEHPLLNCAYYFGGFNKTYSQVYKENAPSGQVDPSINDITYSDNYLMQSEVNNPFYFPLSGRHTIPGGSILGVATTTKALSQGQFGQFPLYVFCSDGIWAMETAPDGTYSNIVPMSRDVCVNPESITGIDGAVVFVSKRGVMMVSGSDIVCLSDDMNGLHFRADSLEGLQGACATYWGSDLPEIVSDNLSFIDYITQCFIAYDYANQRLVFVNENCLYQYIYSIRSQTWHKLLVSSGKSFKRTLNSYPDCYLQENGEIGDAVYNFSGMDDVNDIYTRTFGLVISRAFDLEAPGVLKTIMQLVHRGNFAPDQVRCLLYGSRDNRNYALLHSLKGSSYKSFKIALILNLLPTERISWTEFSFNPKFTNKLR